MTDNAISREIVDAPFGIHTTLGPGLLESVYHAVLAYELAQRGLRYREPAADPGGLRNDPDRHRVPRGPDRRGPGDRRDQVCRSPGAGSQKAASYLSTVGRQTTGPADQFQCCAHQGRHNPYRQWAGRRVSRKVARTPRKPVKARTSASCRFEVEDLARRASAEVLVPNVKACFTREPTAPLRSRL